MTYDPKSKLVYMHGGYNGSMHYLILLFISPLTFVMKEKHWPIFGASRSGEASFRLS